MTFHVESFLIACFVVALILILARWLFQPPRYPLASPIGEIVWLCVVAFCVWLLFLGAVGRFTAVFA